MADQQQQFAASTSKCGELSEAPAAAASMPPLSIHNSSSGARIAIVGCGHGELDKMFHCVESLNNASSSADGRRIDLLICCGDFQSLRNYADMACMACPQKYRQLGTFYKYYTGEKVAPVLTIFIGGNHEASNYLVELFHGGWVAPNIYYMGFASVVNFAGLRIGGLSGIYNDRHYTQGHWEHSPFDDDAMRSVYHVREFEVFQLLAYQRAARTKNPIDIFLSHDWPAHIAHHGNVGQLFRKKKFLEAEVKDGSLGSPPAEKILHALRPKYWFSAHLHVKFPAVVRHTADGASPSSSSTAASPSAPVESLTNFLALDKCLPHRDYMQVLDFPNATADKSLSYDATWLAILKSTYEFLPLTRYPSKPLPNNSAKVSNNTRYQQQHNQAQNQRTDFTPTEAEISYIRQRASAQGLDASLHIPLNFSVTAPGWNNSLPQDNRAQQPPFQINPQTTTLLQLLELQDVISPAYAQPTTSQHGQYHQFRQQHHHQQPHQSYNHQQQPQSHLSPSQIQPQKRQRMDQSSIPAAAQAVHTNPDEIDLDNLEGDDAAPAANPAHNPDEIDLDETGVDEAPTRAAPTAAVANASNPEEINLEDI